MPSEAFKTIINNATGGTPEQVSGVPLAVMFQKIESDLGKRFDCVPVFPKAGRAGNVLRDRVLTSQESDDLFRAAVERSRRPGSQR